MNSSDFSHSERAALRRVVGPLKTIVDFAKDLADGIEKLPLSEVWGRAIPWAVGPIGAFLPLAQGALKCLELLPKERDAHVLGVMACTLAYERSAAVALDLVGKPSATVPMSSPLVLARALKFIDESQIPDRLHGFSMDFPLSHPFIWRADRALRTALMAVGYTEEEYRSVQQKLHDEFRSSLVEIMSSGETAERFQPFRVLLAQGEDASARIAINAHVERQRIQFNERPVLSKEPFAMRDVYVETSCADLIWHDHWEAMKRGLPFDPFRDERPDTPDLLQSVIRRFKDPNFNDAVVLQGPPGSGKSAFTLRLCQALSEEGLRPLRVRLRYLDLSLHLLDALEKVVLRPDEEEDPALSDLPFCRNLFNSGAVFEERTTYGSAEICPYVFIFDGWDEISVTSNDGFHIEIERLLDRIRSQFLSFRKPFVRVLLSGRQSDAIEKSTFLKDDTPILTARPYTSTQLLQYVDKVQRAVRSPRFANLETWPTADWDTIRTSLADERRLDLDVLHLPLLAHLALRLIVQEGVNPATLLEDTTALYRHLIDLTCAKSGKAELVKEDLYRQERISGLELRDLLQRIAIAITVHGQENISFEELELRLSMAEGSLEGTAQAAARNRLTALMISFYFKGGLSHLGCEFLHKSFREYLFAEAVVELIKRYARRQHTKLPPVRRPYWKDFEEHAADDYRYDFSRELSRVLSGQIIGNEIRLHVERLIAWDIQRTTKLDTNIRPLSFGTSTEPLDYAEWGVARDLLADMWEWWTEGVHLRPQPEQTGPGRTWHFRTAYVSELLDQALPQSRDRKAKQPIPRRMTNIDANLGDALMSISVFVHWYLLEAAGFSDWDNMVSAENQQLRAAQSAWRSEDDRLLTSFRPFEGDYFMAYASRINADGWHRFPQNASFRGADLSGIRVTGAIFYNADLRDTNLAKSRFMSVVLENAILTGVNVKGARFIKIDSRERQGISELESADEVQYCLS